MTAQSTADVVLFTGNYSAWPWVTRDSTGRLFSIFREDGLVDRKDTGHGYSPVGRLFLVTSDDRGRTWSPPALVVDNEGLDDVGVGVAMLPDDELLVSYYSRYGPSGSRSQAWVTRSGDGGESWEPSVPTSDQDTRARAAPLVMSNGELLAPIYRSMFSDQGHQSIAAISWDDGRTWENHVVPNTPEDEANEWAVLEVEPGRILGLHRDEGKGTGGYFWKTESQDWGRTWAGPVRTNVRDAGASSPPQLDRHGSRVVLTFADRRLVSVSMVSTSDPEYMEWEVGERVPCFQYRADGKAIADASYPCSVAVGRRRRLVVDYEIESLILPSADRSLDYEVASERRQITGHFVDTPAAWGDAAVAG